MTGSPLACVGQNLIESNSAITPALSGQILHYKARRVVYGSYDHAYACADTLARCHPIPHLTYLHLVGNPGADENSTVQLFTVFLSMPALDTLIVQNAGDLPEGCAVPAPPFRLRCLRWAFKGYCTFQPPTGTALAALLSSSPDSLQDLLLCDSLAPTADSHIFTTAFMPIAPMLTTLRLPHWDVLRYQQPLRLVLASCTNLRQLSIQLAFGALESEERRREREALSDLLHSLDAPLRHLEVYVRDESPAHHDPDWQTPITTLDDLRASASSLRSLRSLSFNMPRAPPGMGAALLRLASDCRLSVRVRARDDFDWSAP
ncbi:hypothetical protein AURDEDRAFT_161748 [Auricularia subglabra TFB-10046 SS5]|nr:hypothetical protein AURDEDRAFT_161748 [Auricularia subglabra TFB-10046 SS5]